MNFVEELRWRGMIHNIMPGTEEQLAKEQTTAYVGIDPTADSLHIGHLVSVMMMKHLQMAGHKPIFVIGGATGMIGDPSGKSLERNLLDEDTIQKNMAGIKAQLSKFIDFNSNEPNDAERHVFSSHLFSQAARADDCAVFGHLRGPDEKLLFSRFYTGSGKTYHGELHDVEGFREKTIECRFDKRDVVHGVYLSIGARV